MTSRKILLLALWLCGNATANTSLESTPAISVSPGGIEAPTWLTNPCPTFSWGSAPEATGYELTVFGVLDGFGATYEEQYAQGKPVLETRVAAPALSWTPCQMIQRQ